MAASENSPEIRWRGEGKWSIRKTHISHRYVVECMNVVLCGAFICEDCNIVTGFNKGVSLVLDPYVWRKTKVGKHPHSHCRRRPARLGRAMELPASVDTIKDAW
jgi:hypothetical protein